MEPELNYRRFRFPAADGTSLVGWTNDAEDKPPLLVANGLGVPPEAWPTLLSDEPDYWVAGWNHRGALGSERPVDPEAFGVPAHVDDAFALMDRMGWGVGGGRGLVHRRQRRVRDGPPAAGPGVRNRGTGWRARGTFESGFGYWMVPKPLRRHVSMGVVQGGRALGAPLTTLARVVPKGRPFAEALRWSGFMMPRSNPEHAVPWIKAFLEHDFHWYFTLGVAAAEHEPIDPSFVQVPVTVAAGGFDVMTSARDVMAFAEKIPHAVAHLLHGTHMLPLEFPDLVLGWCMTFTTRCTTPRLATSACKQRVDQAPVPAACRAPPPWPHMPRAHATTAAS